MYVDVTETLPYVNTTYLGKEIYKKKWIISASFPDTFCRMILPAILACMLNGWIWSSFDTNIKGISIGETCYSTYWQSEVVAYMYMYTLSTAVNGCDIGKFSNSQAQPLLNGSIILLGYMGGCLKAIQFECLTGPLHTRICGGWVGVILKAALQFLCWNLVRLLLGYGGGVTLKAAQFLCWNLVRLLLGYRGYRGGGNF